MNPKAETNHRSHAASEEPDWTSLITFTDERRIGSREVLALTGGASLGVERGRYADKLTLRGRSGEVQLRITMGPEGPLLSFTSADVEIESAGSLAIVGETVTVRAHGRLELGAGGDMDVAVDGRRHSRIGGRDLTEADAIESQANEGDIVLRAREDVRIDGEHIGLNDERCPGPLSWTAPAAKGGA